MNASSQFDCSVTSAMLSKEWLQFSKDVWFLMIIIILVIVVFTIITGKLQVSIKVS